MLHRSGQARSGQARSGQARSAQAASALTAAWLPLAGLLLSGCPGEEVGCSRDNHCVLDDDGVARCENGYRWEDEALLLCAENTCGDGVRGADEVCDGADTGGETCVSLGYDEGGTLRCADDCRGYDRSQCAGGSSCGNGVIEAGEACDDGRFANDDSCAARGFGPGALACTSSCQVDVAGCGAPASCGNGVVDTVEVCDGANLDGATCADLGRGPGSLTCLANCGGYDPSGCGPSLSCGNGVLDVGEVCDGAAFGGRSCHSEGFGDGQLACASDCQSYATDDCAELCEPACDGKSCGADGCGGSCGSCGSGQVCFEGGCLDGSCPGGTDECGGECADVLSDPNNCGGCGYSCPSVPGATRQCTAGACTPICPGQGAGIDFDTDVDNCGGCNEVCEDYGVSWFYPDCNAGDCAYPCTASESLCPTAFGGNDCIDTHNDPYNCGSCGHECPSASGGYPTCSNGVCGGPCGSGQSVCSTAGGDVCASLQSDPQNCGSCGHVCPANGGTPQCVQGQCQTSCGYGTAMCGGSSCIDILSDEQNCGGCGNTCTSSNGTAQCVNGQCQVDCAPGLEACPIESGNSVVWQCVDTENSPWHCGGCGNFCGDVLPGNAMACHEGTCGQYRIVDGPTTCNSVCSQQGLVCAETSSEHLDGCYGSSGWATCYEWYSSASTMAGCANYQGYNGCTSTRFGCSTTPPSTGYISGGGIAGQTCWCEAPAGSFP